MSIFIGPNMIFFATAALLQIPFQPLNHKPLPPSQNDFYFVAMGDNRPAGAGLPPTHTFKELLKEISVIDPTFVISTGDLLYGNEESLDQYKQEEAWMKPLVDTLPCPFYNVPGNHEVNNRPEFLDEYTKTMGAAYGKFDFGGYRFVAVCTELAGANAAVDGSELAWLKQEFGKPQPTITFEHHPVFERPGNSDTQEEACVANATEMSDLYKQGGVKLAFEGHDHVYNRQEHDGVSYIIAGGSGAPLDAAPTDGGYFHFVLVHVSPSGVDATPVPMGAIEVVDRGDGSAVISDYADVNLPVSNLTITSKQKPAGVSAGYKTKKGKVKEVDSRILETRATGNGYETRVALVLPKHHATFVTLSF